MFAYWLFFATSFYTTFGQQFNLFAALPKCIDQTPVLLSSNYIVLNATGLSGRCEFYSEKLSFFGNPQAITQERSQFFIFLTFLGRRRLVRLWNPSSRGVHI